MAGPFDFLFGGGDQPQESAPVSPQAYRPPREAAESGTIMGFIDSMRGVPTRQQVMLGERERLRQDELGQQRSKNQATTAVLERMNQLREKSPGLPPQQLFQAIINDPVFTKNAMQQDPAEMVEFINTIKEGLYGSPETTKMQGFAPGTHVVQGMKPDGTPNVIYKVPKEGGGDKREELAVGGSPRLQALGIADVRPGERVVLQTKKTPDGAEVVDEIKFPDRPLVDLGRQAEQEQVRELSKRGSDIRTRQGYVVNAARMFDRMETQLKDGGSANLGWAGVFQRTAQGLVSQAQDIAREANLPFDPQSYKGPMSTIFRNGRFDKNAANSAALQSNILAFAFTMAKAQNKGGQVTQKDVDSALTQMGAGMTGSKEQFMAAMRETLWRGVTGIDDEISVNANLFGPNADGRTLVAKPESTRKLLEQSGFGRLLQQPRSSPGGGQPRSEQRPDTQTKPKFKKGDAVRGADGKPLYYSGSGDPMSPQNWSNRKPN